MAAAQARSAPCTLDGTERAHSPVPAGKTPYHGKRLTQVTRARDSREPPYDPADAMATNEGLARPPGRGVLSLLRHCLADDPEERPSMRQCVRALAPLAGRLLQKNAIQLHAAARCAPLATFSASSSASALHIACKATSAAPAAELTRVPGLSAPDRPSWVAGYRPCRVGACM